MQREYGLDLATVLDGMSWRRFLVLVRGLSPSSALVTAMGSRVRLGGKRAPASSVAGPTAVQRTFEALFKPSGRA